jgi:small subunit ribosomal protein S20
VANIKSQIKRNRQNNNKRLRNRVYRGEARLAVKNARSTIQEGTTESKEAVRLAISALDKAAEQGVLHKNNAARRKSRLVKALAGMEPVKVQAQASPSESVVESAPSESAPKEKKKAASRTSSAKEEKTEVSAAESKEVAPKKSAVKKSKAKKTTTQASADAEISTATKES